MRTYRRSKSAEESSLIAIIKANPGRSTAQLAELAQMRLQFCRNLLDALEDEGRIHSIKQPGKTGARQFYAEEAS